MFYYRKVTITAILAFSLCFNFYSDKLIHAKRLLGDEGCLFVEADIDYVAGEVPAGLHVTDACILPSGEMEDIKGLTSEVKAKLHKDGLDLDEGASGHTILKISGATIENHVLTIPEGAEIKAEDGRSIRRGLPGKQKSLKFSGTKKVFVLRADAPDSNTTINVEDISDKIFGTNGDAVNLKSQIEACSYKQLIFEPFSGNFNEHKIEGGVGEVTLTVNVMDVDSNVVKEAMLDAAEVKYGKLSDKVSNNELHYVILCLPAGTSRKGSTKWVAYAYEDHWLSVYNDEWCAYPSAQIHEIGHNLNLGHSNEKKSYDDTTGMMGFSMPKDDKPVMCFNAANNWQLGWFPNGRHSIKPLESDSFIGNLIGLSDYGSLTETSTEKVMIQILGHEQDYYVSFNREIGINSGTREGKNQVLVHSRKPGSGYSNSKLEAKMDQGEHYTIGTGSDRTIVEVVAIDIEANPGFAEVKIVRVNPSNRYSKYIRKVGGKRRPSFKWNHGQ